MRKTKKFWGWGYEGFEINQKAFNKTKAMLQFALGVSQLESIEAPKLANLRLRASRFKLPASIASICTNATYDRAAHSYGKSFRDIWRGLHGQFDNPPDYVSYPKTEADIEVLMAFASRKGISLIPFGGGSSVVGGVEPSSSALFKGAITVDLKYFNQILEIDKQSRTARIQAGIFGPELEAGLKPHGLTLRHFPQSFEFSTLGGWIATRSGGHFATLYTHIDEFIQSLRMISPNGVMQTRRLPGSGAGPSEERLLAGSEGILGIITEAWMRLQDIPKFKLSQTVRFRHFMQGVEACRAIAQSGLNPSNARLVSPLEALSNGLGNGQDTIMILGFESHDHPLHAWMDRALAICESFGGKWTSKNDSSTKSTQKDVAASQWKSSFLQAPYARDELMKLGFIVETFETAVSWDQFESFHQGVEAATQAAIKEYCGKGIFTCRFTHLYPDGPAPYYTVIAKGKAGQQLVQWDNIKAAASQAIIDHGGTITHHHAVGKDHLPYYEQQRSKPYGDILASIKRTLDPSGILNPGVLIGEGNEGMRK